MLINLSTYTETPISEIKMPWAFSDALTDALLRIDAHHKEMQLSYVLLFGSVAREEASFGSDIDLLLLTDADSERDIRRKVLAYDLDDDIAYIPVQITVRKTSRFVDEESDVCDFHKAIIPDLRLLRRYGPC